LKNRVFRILVFKQAKDPRKFIQIDRFLIDDIVDGLRGLGQEVMVFDLEDPKNLTNRVKAFSPEIILIRNDVDKETLDVIEESSALKIYWITAPAESFEHLKGRSCLVFCAERMDVERLKRIGISAHYLPVGVNPKVFNRIQSSKEKEGLRCDISFAGSSYGGYISWWLKRSIQNPSLKREMEKIFRHRMMDREDEILSILRGMEKRLGVSFHIDDPDNRKRFLDRLRYGAIGLYRYEIIRAIQDLGLHLYGDQGWMEYEELKGHYQGWLHPRKELPLLYRASKINLNICVSRSGPNLRLFEATSCGGFVLTNYIDGLEEIFRLDEEIAHYRNTDELREKILYYLSHQDEREEIAKNGMERTLRDHTFLHRMKEMLKIIQREHLE
jgi:spore maturation protein CgeB